MYQQLCDLYLCVCVCVCVCVCEMQHVCNACVCACMRAWVYPFWDEHVNIIRVLLPDWTQQLLLPLSSRFKFWHLLRDSMIRLKQEQQIRWWRDVCMSVCVSVCLFCMLLWDVCFCLCIIFCDGCWCLCVCVYVCSNTCVYPERMSIFCVCIGL